MNSIKCTYDNKYQKKVTSIKFLKNRCCLHDALHRNRPAGGFRSIYFQIGYYAESIHIDRKNSANYLQNRDWTFFDKGIGK